jgi:hypothetical protein
MWSFLFMACAYGTHAEPACIHIEREYTTQAQCQRVGDFEARSAYAVGLNYARWGCLPPAKDSK